MRIESALSVFRDEMISIYPDDLDKKAANDDMNLKDFVILGFDSAFDITSDTILDRCNIVALRLFCGKQKPGRT
jgi:hypothetical protein